MKNKASSVDYSKAMLPRKRREQFFDCFKMNYLVILKCGLFLLLFSLPLIGFCFFMDFYYVSLMSHATEEVEQTRLIFHYIYNIGIVLFSLLLVISLTGVVRVLRNLIWGEGIFFKDDFSDGIKQNCAKNAIFAVIFGIIYLIAFVIYSLFPETLISLFGLFMFALIFLPIYLWIVLLNNTYDAKWTGLMRNSLFFYVKTIGWSLLAMIFPISLVCLILIPIELIWIKYIVLTLAIIFLLPIYLLIMILYSTSKFDIYINKENYADHYLRGLNND